VQAGADAATWLKDQWTTIANGRRIHDLWHTAACLWLARGVDPATVQAWMGHASIATTNLYLHHLGTAYDRVGLARLNQSAGCIRVHRETRPQNHRSLSQHRICRPT
jgi:integrase